MDAARAEAHLRNLEPAAFAEQDILARDADIVEAHVHMTLRRMVGAEHAHRTEHLPAGRVHRHEDLRMLRLTCSYGIVFDHAVQYLAAWVPGAPVEIFLAFDDSFIAFGQY